MVGLVEPNQLDPYQLAILLGSSWLGGMVVFFVSRAVHGDAVALTMPADYLAGLAIVRTFTLALWSTAETAVYVELRAVKDGPVVNQLEEIFA